MDCSDTDSIVSDSTTIPWVLSSETESDNEGHNKPLHFTYEQLVRECMTRQVVIRIQIDKKNPLTIRSTYEQLVSECMTRKVVIRIQRQVVKNDNSRRS